MSDSENNGAPPDEEPPFIAVIFHEEKKSVEVQFPPYFRSWEFVIMCLEGALRNAHFEANKLQAENEARKRFEAAQDQMMRARLATEGR